jgi:subfamily B ATP-binding cassette protein MsbA
LFFCSVLVAGAIIGRVVSQLKQESVNVQDSIANLTAQVDETLGGMRIIKGFNAEKYNVQKFDKENNFFRNTSDQGNK